MKLTQLAAAMAMTTASASALAATYTVTPVPVRDISINNFAQSIDESGFTVTMTSAEFNPPIDLDFLEESGFIDNNASTFESEDDVRQGIFSDVDYTTIVTGLLSHSTTARNAFVYQHLTPYRSYITDTTDADLIPGLDAWSELFDDYAHAVTTYARDSLNGDYVTGSTEGPYYELDYEDEDGNDTTYVLTDIKSTAFVSVNGETKLLASEDDTLNGLSQAFAINNNLQVVGNSMVDHIEGIDDAIEACEEEETRGDIPVEYCYRSIRVDASSDTSTYGFRLPAVGDRSTPGVHIRATVWQLDANGNTITTDTYPLVFEPDADDESAYWSLAQDINDQGIAVGASSLDEIAYIRRPSGYSYERLNVAVSYAEGETTEMLPRDENIMSEAVAINNDNWVTGYVLRAPNDTARNRVFVYNLDTGEALYPEGFFTNAGAEGKGINNNNIVVGSSEYDSTVDTNRETHGFMYDIEAKEMTDLNDLLPCDSVYTIVDAIDINDSNEIIANARYRTGERYVTGVEVIDDEGETPIDDTIIAVKLTPLENGEVETCDIPEDEIDDVAYERKGAAISPWWLLLTGGLLAFRRRKQ